MIVKKMEINGHDFTYVHADGRYLLKRSDGLLLACDLYENEEYTYEETDMVIGEKQDYETAAKILLGLEV